MTGLWIAPADGDLAVWRQSDDGPVVVLRRSTIDPELWAILAVNLPTDGLEQFGPDVSDGPFLRELGAI